MMHVTVYTWQADTDLPPGRQAHTALRVWGDLILEVVANERNLAVEPSVTIRRDAIFALLGTDIPAATRAPSGAHLIELTVDAERSAVARLDLADPLFFPTTWRRFHQWLVDGHGYDPAYIEEEFLPTSAPLTRMKPSAAPELLAYTDPRLLELLVEFFSPLALPYLQSWGPLSEVTSGGHDDLEVIVPPGAINASELDQTREDPR